MMCQHRPWKVRTRRSNAPGAPRSTASASSRSLLGAERSSIAPLGYARGANGCKCRRCNRRGGRRLSCAEPVHHRSKPMNFEILIPITLFICIVYAIKVVVDARVRRQMVTVGGSEELV